MTAPMPAEFILARVADTEHQVKDGAPGVTTSYYGWHTVDCGVGLGYWANQACECRYVDRVLAQCAAYRGLVEEHSCVHSACPGSPTLTSDDGEQDGTYGGPCAVLRNLASIWADHADFNPEWRP